jgi:ribosomal protein L18
MSTTQIVAVFSGFRNDDLKNQIIEKLDGRVMTIISKSATHLIVKETAKGSKKIDEAKELGMEIVTLEDFITEHNLDLITKPKKSSDDENSEHDQHDQDVNKALLDIVQEEEHIEEPKKKTVVKKTKKIVEEPEKKKVVVKKTKKVSEEPVAVVEEPVLVVEEPKKKAVVKKTKKIVEEPVVIVEEPVAVVEEPVVIVEEPVVVVEEPEKKKTVVKKTKKVVEEPEPEPVTPTKSQLNVEAPVFIPDAPKKKSKKAFSAAIAALNIEIEAAKKHLSELEDKLIEMSK